MGKGLSAFGFFADDDARRAEVVIEGFPFAQKLRREDKILAVELAVLS